MRTAAAVLALGLAGVTISAQNTSPFVPGVTRTTATLAGTLSGPGSSDGFEGLRVTLLTFGNVALYETMTEAEGEFLFKEIRPGAYIVALQRGDYTVELGRVRLLPGERLVRRYLKGVVIAGRVVDERGAPVPAAPICLLRPRTEAGIVRYERAASEVTNARGRFVVGLRANLSRGKYVAAVVPTGCDTVAPPKLANPGLARYPPTYFPATTASRDASMLTLIEQEDAELVFQIRPGRVTRLEGKISNYINTSVVPGQVILDPLTDEPMSIVRATKIFPDGSFSFPGLVPGQYRLIVAPQKGPDPLRWAVRTVTLAGELVARVPIVTQPTSAIAGTIDFTGHLTALYGTRIFLTVNATVVGERPSVARLLAENFSLAGLDGKFGIIGLMPGRYRISVSGAQVVGWLNKSAMVPSPSTRLPDIDAFDVPLTLEPNRSVFGIQVQMTYKVTRLYGRIDDDEGRPTGEAFAVVFAADPRYWINGSRRLTRVKADGGGAFNIEGLPEGDYLAVAVRSIPTWPDPAWLESMRAVAVPLRLGDGEARDVNLRLPGATVLPR